MFSSRTLADRNNDPKPWWPDGAEFDEQRFAKGEPYEGEYLYWHPRPEFQHGVLPENPILVAFKRRLARSDDRVKLYDRWLADMETELAAHDDSYLASLLYTERQHVVHAHRVLTLVSKLGANQ